jgi:hypothetical protein
MKKTGTRRSLTGAAFHTKRLKKTVMQVNFSFIQEIKTAHPLHILQCEFFGTADIADDFEQTVTILNVSVKDSFKPYTDFKQLAITQIDKQDEETGDMARFLALCREAARKELHAQHKAAQVEVYNHIVRAIKQ